MVPVFSSSFTPSAYPGPPPPSLYRAVAPGRSHSVLFVVQVRSGDPALYGQKLQEITASVDPTMEVEFVAGVAELWEREQRGMRLLALIVIAVDANVLLLSAAGIHAMMSFTVGRRWREIGIRVALGADARRVLTGILGRASAQIGAGVAAGLSAGGDPRVGDAGRECRWQGVDSVPDGRGRDISCGATGSGWPGAPRAGE